MARPDGMVHFIPPGQEEINNFISTAANQSVRPYNTNEEYLYAMKEDLAEWLKNLYDVDIHINNFMELLENGILLCEHANQVNSMADEFRMKHKGEPILKKIILPSKTVFYNKGHHASTFFARDNVANFINWCRKELLIAESVMFETSDLVLRMNEKNFILCLLEVARRGSKFGVPAPVLIQMEEDIDKEIERDEQAEEEGNADQVDNYYEDEPQVPKEPEKQKVPQDFKSLDEMVQYILGMCTCPTQFPMVKVGEGKYKIGDSKTNIFMRILRNHVMVRVGGGWDTLEHYLDKHDPCRCNRHRVEQKISARSVCSGEELVKCSLQRESHSNISKLSMSKPQESYNGVPSRSSQMDADSPRKSTQSRVSRSAEERFHNRSSSSPGAMMHEKKCTESSGSKTPRKSTASKSQQDSRSTSVARSKSPRPSRNLNQNNSNMQTPPRATTPTNSHARTPRSSEHTRPSLSISKKSKFRNSTTNLTSPMLYENTRDTVRSKTPTPSDIRSRSSTTLSLDNQRRCITPTPTVTSQRRATLSLQRSKSPDPDQVLNSSSRPSSSSSSWKSPRHAPPSSFKTSTSETLPRNFKSGQSTPRSNNQQAASRSNQRSSTNSRPSSAKSYSNLSSADHKKHSTNSNAPTTLQSSKARYSSMQDIRPRSAISSTSCSNISSSSNVQSTKTSKPRSSDIDTGFKRLSTGSRSRSMDNVAYQKSLSVASSERTSVYDRLSQPKGTPRVRNRSTAEQYDMLMVERKSTGQHTLHKEPSQESNDSFNRPITPIETHRRSKLNNEFNDSLQLNLIQTSTPSSPSSKDSPTGSLKFNISLSSDSTSPTRVMYSLDSGVDTFQSNDRSQSNGGHTPKIMASPIKESYLKPPPKRKVSTEEMIQVLRDQEGRHAWEHTDTSIEKSKELTDLSPYKEQIETKSTIQSPRQSQAQPTWANRRSQYQQNSKSNTKQNLEIPARKLSSSSSEYSNPPKVETSPKAYASPYRRVTSPRPSNIRKSESPDVKRETKVSSRSAGNLRTQKNNKTPTVLQKANVSDQVRKQLNLNESKTRNSSSSRPSSTLTTNQASSTLPRNYTHQRPESSYVSPSRTLERQRRSVTPTPKSGYRSSQSPRQTTELRARSKTPDPKDFYNHSKMGTWKRQEKMKDWDGPRQRNPSRSNSLECDAILVSPTKESKEDRMLRDMEQELVKNQQILQKTSPVKTVEEAEPSNKVEYDYNGRRIRKKSTSGRSKSPAPTNKKAGLRSKSERNFSYDSGSTTTTENNNEAVTPSYAESLADSEDFEVAMAMKSAIRSKSMDDVLRPTSAKPRKDNLPSDARKSRIPTPVSFNSGRKSATEFSVHNSQSEATKSNVSGLSTHELRLHELRHAKEQDDYRRMMEEQRRQQNQSQQEAEDAMIHHKFDNGNEFQNEQEKLFFEFGSYGSSNGKYKSSVIKRASPSHVDQNGSQHKSILKNSPERQQTDEPVVPPRRKNTEYHRRRRDFTPAMMMKPTQHSINDRNDSGIEIADPESPSSCSLKSSAADSSSAKSSVFSPDRMQVYDPTIPQQSMSLNNQQKQSAATNSNQTNRNNNYYSYSPQKYNAQSAYNQNTMQESPTRNSVAENNSFYSDNEILRNRLRSFQELQTSVDSNQNNIYTTQQGQNSPSQRHYSAQQYANHYSDNNNNNCSAYEGDVPPEPPPRRKSSFRAVQKSKHPEFAQNYYTNQNQQKVYRMPNGVEILQNIDSSEPMYV